MSAAHDPGELSRANPQVESGLVGNEYIRLAMLPEGAVTPSMSHRNIIMLGRELTGLHALYDKGQVLFWESNDVVGNFTTTPLSVIHRRFHRAEASLEFIDSNNISRERLSFGSEIPSGASVFFGTREARDPVVTSIARGEGELLQKYEELRTALNKLREEQKKPSLPARLKHLGSKIVHRSA